MAQHLDDLWTQLEQEVAEAKKNGTPFPEPKPVNLNAT